MKGRCRYCHAKIAWQYPIVEILGGCVALIAGYEFGASWNGLAVCCFGWLLIVISFIDIKTQLAPDVLTIPLLWLGLFVSCFEWFTNSHDAILGAIFGYGFLWSIGKLYQWLRKKEGIGLGDCKLLAAVGAWLGWQLLPFIILFSSISGALIGISFLSIKKLSSQTPISFAPFIALAAWIAIIWGFDVTELYLSLLGIGWTNV